LIKPEGGSRVVIVPCFNESKRIISSNFLSLVDELKCKILFVDDGSTDDTVSKLRSLPIVSSAYSIVSLPKNGGKANAISTGIRVALDNDFEFIGLFDADGAINPIDLGAAFSLIESTPDVSVVTGARVLLAGNGVTRKPQRRWIGRVIATLVSLIIEIQVYDPQSPSKVYRATDLKKISNLQVDTKWFGDAEVLFQLKQVVTQESKWILEFPVTSWQDVDGSNLSLLSFFRILGDLKRLSRKCVSF
jgi:glycosyltransferase involved in cell wall biosynthesis